MSPQRHEHPSWSERRTIVETWQDVGCPTEPKGPVRQGQFPSRGSFPHSSGGAWTVLGLPRTPWVAWVLLSLIEGLSSLAESGGHTFGKVVAQGHSRHEREFHLGVVF